MASTTPDGSKRSQANKSETPGKNKLGYTRISIACVHCRRRKIRCIRHDEDTERPCVNCTKLKKECIYTGIDVVTASESRSRPRIGRPSHTSSAISRPNPDSKVERPPDDEAHVSSGPMLVGTTRSYTDPTSAVLSSAIPDLHDARLARVSSTGTAEFSSQIPTSYHHQFEPTLSSQPLQTSSPGYESAPPPMNWMPATDHMRQYAFHDGYHFAPQPNAIFHTTQAQVDNPQFRRPSLTEHSVGLTRPPQPILPPNVQRQQPHMYNNHSTYQQESHPVSTQAVNPNPYYARAPDSTFMVDDSRRTWESYAPQLTTTTSPRHDSVITKWPIAPTYLRESKTHDATSYQSGPARNNGRPG